MNNPLLGHAAHALPTESENERLLRRMIALDGMPRVVCPFGAGLCAGLVHIVGSLLGRRVPPASSSGVGLIIEFACENGHRWKLNLCDHSGALWIGLEELPNTTKPTDGFQIAE